MTWNWIGSLVPASAWWILALPLLALCHVVGQEAAPLRTADLAALEGFVPSVAGKKLLHYRAPAFDASPERMAELEQVAFDGAIVGGFRPFYKNEKEFDFDAWAAGMREVPFQRYTDNFYLCYSGVDAVEKTDFDWFHDFSWICDNWRTMAKAARDAGFKGICFDSEHYGGKPLFGYHAQTYAATKSFEDYQTQARRRGAEIMRAVNEVYPDITILFLFGYSGSYNGVPQHPLANAKSYTLVSAFVDGLLSECGPGATIHDMHEQSFGFRVPGSYARARRQMKHVVAQYSAVPDKYAAQHKAGFSIWADCWENAGQGRALNVDDFEINYYTPHELAYTIHQALAWSDKYVWMWPGVFRFWEGKLKTVDAAGNELEVPIPPQYMNALAWAHEATVPAPPRDRKPNAYRNEEAHTWKGWSDEEAFGDLWDRYEPLRDLPERWRFRLDPDEVGVQQGWFLPDHDTGDWDEIRIREFWEVQGPSPYDGCAWYRTVLDATEDLSGGRPLFLAFGGVADEAAVYINGRLAYASEVGDNIRHKRFLVDVGNRLLPGKPNHIAVRVWNVSWCGGIWKNVKLVARKSS